MRNLTPTPHYLIVAPAWVGDMVMAQVLLRHLKQQHPESTIDVVAPNWVSDLAAFFPEVRQVFPFEVKHGEFGLKARYLLGRKLRQNYTHAIILPNSWKSALIPWFAKIPKRTGFKGEWRYGLLNDVRYLDKQTLPLMIQRFAALGFENNQTLPKDLLWPELHIDRMQQKATLNSLGLHLTSSTIALCPGAEYGPAKRWPAEYFAALANLLLAAGYQVALFGSPKEKDIADHIQQLTNQKCINLIGKTNLSQAIQLLDAMSAMLCHVKKSRNF